MTDHPRVLAAMNGPGDRAKLSASAIKAQKRAALAALEAKKKAAMKSPKKSAAPLKKAAANKKVVRKTMKAGKKKH